MCFELVWLRYVVSNEPNVLLNELSVNPIFLFILVFSRKKKRFGICMFECECK